MIQKWNAKTHIPIGRQNAFEVGNIGHIGVFILSEPMNRSSFDNPFVAIVAACFGQILSGQLK